ncbi:MAG TPA: hypothetical protein VIL27_07920, partial [Clostridia bacterium]
MQEPLGDRYSQDKAIVMSIVKYLLVAAILVAAGYVGIKLFWILFPFILGFILARASSSISKSILLFFNKLRKGKNFVATETLAMDEPEFLVNITDIGGEKKSTGMVLSVAIFAFLLLLFIGLIVLTIFNGAAQIRNLIDKLPHFFNVDSINGFLDSLRNLSDQLGGLLPPSAIAAIGGEIYSLQQLVLNQVPGIASSLLNFILGMMAGLPIFFFWIVVIIVSGYFFLTDKRSVHEFLRRNIPSESFVTNIVQLVNRLFTTLFRTIGGYMLLLIITFILSLITLLAIKMP